MPLQITSNNVKCDLFADDSTLHTSNKELIQVQKDLQQSLNDVANWCNKNLIALNPSKTKSMTITTRQRHQLGIPPLQLYINNNSIQEVTEHRLLGILIDNQLTWKSHVMKISKNISKNIFLLSKLKNYLDIKYRKMFFCAHIKPYIDYVSNVLDT